MRLEDDFTDAIKFNQIPCAQSDIHEIAQEVKRFYLKNAKTKKEMESRLVDVSVIRAGTTTL